MALADADSSLNLRPFSKHADSPIEMPFPTYPRGKHDPRAWLSSKQSVLDQIHRSFINGKRKADGNIVRYHSDIVYPLHSSKHFEQLAESLVQSRRDHLVLGIDWSLMCTKDWPSIKLKRFLYGRHRVRCFMDRPSV